MNLICKLFGHKWRDTSSRQYVKIDGRMVDCWTSDRYCDRCGIDKRVGIIPTDIEYAMLAGSEEIDKKVVGILPKRD